MSARRRHGQKECDDGGKSARPGESKYVHSDSVAVSTLRLVFLEFEIIVQATPSREH